MFISIESDSKSFKINTDVATPISIAMQFNAEQPSAFGVDAASANPLEAGSFIGSVARGGSANCDQINIIPHCNGTHSETIGHIVTDSVPIPNILGTQIFHAATLVSVAPQRNCTERYQPALEGSDLVISAEMLRNALGARKSVNTLVVRTQPNETSKCARNYAEVEPPFFSNDAMEYIVSLGVQHLVVDFPSVDKAWDEGKLSNHRIFWNVEPGVKRLVGNERIQCTITEMVYVPDEVGDGEYILSIQVPHFIIDAAPSRLLLYPIKEI